MAEDMDEGRKTYNDDECRALVRCCKALAMAMARHDRDRESPTWRDECKPTELREIGMRPLHAFTELHYRAIRRHAVDDLCSREIAREMDAVDADLSPYAVLSMEQQGIAMAELYGWEPATVSVAEAAKVAGVSRQRAYQMVESGELVCSDAGGRREVYVESAKAAAGRRIGR